MSDDRPRKGADNRRGILAMLVAMSLFMTSDICLKLASSSMPVGQILFLRGLVSIPLLLTVAWATGNLGGLVDVRRRLVLTRAVLEVGVAATFISALSLLPIAEVTALGQATPLMLTLLVVALGLERVDSRRWAAVLVGLVGVLLVIQPSFEGFRPGTLLALATAFLVVLRDMATRRIAGTVSSYAITLASAVAVTTAGSGLLSLNETWITPSWNEMRFVLLSGVVVIGGNFAMVVSCRDVDLSVIAPWRYSVVVWGLAAGILVWGEVPNALALFGTSLVVASGLYTLHREQARARLERAGE